MRSNCACNGGLFQMNVKRIAYTFSISAGTALLGATFAIAQAPGAPQQPSMPQSQTPNSGAQSPNNPSTTQTAGAPTSAQDFSERAFISKAMEGGMAEVQLGQLAQEKSQSNDVKQFGAKMVNDHGQMGEKWLKPVARQMGLSEPKG